MKPEWSGRLLEVLVTVVLWLMLIGAGAGDQKASKTRTYASLPSPPTKALQPDIVPGVVVVKVKSSIAAEALAEVSTVTGLSSLDAKLQRLGAANVQKMFRPRPISPNSGVPDITRILKVSIPERMNPVMVARELGRDPNVEYAEPVYVRRLVAVPNDPMYSQQQYLQQIHAPEAWDVQRGDSNVIIAILDTGVDYEHEDLAGNVWINELEADGVTGVDDDGNGFVDDIHGWDFGNGTNGNPNTLPPDEPGWNHGTHVAGIACAVTNNQTGVAGVSWNCRYMPVKFGPTNVEYTQGYAGIIYAADNGADIISNSWGGHGFLRWEQDVIDYVYSKGAVIVCAAGNDNDDLPFYPASYQHAISVAAVDRYDRKASYSTYGPSIDISAPGGDLNGGILSTLPHNAYASSNWMGTSMAAPMVAGVCALVKSLHPDWSNEQIVRHVLLTADDIDALNPTYSGKLGHGRLNALRALTDSVWQEPDARLVCHSSVVSDSLFGNDNGVLERGETIHCTLDIRNCSISATPTAVVQLSSTSTNIHVLSGTAGPMFFPGDTVLPFTFALTISDAAPAEEVDLIVTLQTGGGYSRVDRVPIFIGMMPLLLIDHDCAQPNYGIPNIEPFFRNILDQQKVPYRYWDTRLDGFQSAILQGSPIVVLSCPWWGSSINREERDALRGYLDGGGNLFFCSQDIGSYFYDVDASQEARSFMQDYLHADFVADNSGDRTVRGLEGDAISSGLSFHVWQPGFALESQAPEVVAPTSGARTIFTYNDGRAAAISYHGDHKVVYLGFGLEAVDTDQNTIIGDTSPIRTELLMRVINWLSFIEHTPLSDTENADSARTVLTRITGNVNDHQAVTLFWRVRGDSAFTAVAMAEADSVDYAAVIPGPGRACQVEYFIETTHPCYTWSSPVGAPDTVYHYQVGATDVLASPALPEEFRLYQNYPNPFNPLTRIRYGLPLRSHATLTVFNTLGQQVAQLVNGAQDAGYHEVKFDGSGLASGVYLYRMQAGSYVETKKLLLVR